MSSFLPTETPNKAVVVSHRTVLAMLLLVSSLVLARRKQERIDSCCAVMFVSKTSELEEKTWRGGKRVRGKRERESEEREREERGTQLLEPNVFLL